MMTKIKNNCKVIMKINNKPMNNKNKNKNHKINKI